MKAFLILAALVLIAVVCGWLTFSYTNGKVGAEFDSVEMKQDVEKTVETVKQKTNEGIEEIKEKVNQP